VVVFVIHAIATSPDDIKFKPLKPVDWFVDSGGK